MVKLNLTENNYIISNSDNDDIEKFDIDERNRNYNFEKENKINLLENKIFKK